MVPWQLCRVDQERRTHCFDHNFKTRPSICVIFGTLRECLAANTSVNFIFINYTKIKCFKCVRRRPTCELRIRDGIATGKNQEVKVI